MIDAPLRRRQGIDLLRVVAEGAHGVAHGGEIHHRRHAGEVLQQYPRRGEGDFGGRLGFGVPSGNSSIVQSSVHGEIKFNVPLQIADNRAYSVDTLFNEGAIDVKPGSDYDVEMVISDLAGNQTLLRIPVVGNALPVLEEDTPEKTPYFVFAGKPASFKLEGAQVYFPANSFYQDFYLNLESDTTFIRIHEPTIAVHRNFTLTFDVSHLPESGRERYFIARLDESDRPQFQKTFRRGDTFTARSRGLGRYTLALDTVPPVVRPKNFKAKQWLTNYRYLSLKISDDLSGISSYSATLNGRWILMEYEPKTRTLTYNFDDQIVGQQQCNLEVEVTDNVGNTEVFTIPFFKR